MKKEIIENGGFKFWPEVKITRLIDIFSAVFWNQFFHGKKPNLIRNLSDYPQILTVGRLTHKQQTRVCEFFSPEMFFSMRANTPYFLVLFRKCSLTFHFSALGPETEGHIK